MSAECPWDTPIDAVCPKHGGALRDCPGLTDDHRHELALASLAALLRRVANLEKGDRVIE